MRAGEFGVSEEARQTLKVSISTGEEETHSCTYESDEPEPDDQASLLILGAATFDEISLQDFQAVIRTITLKG